MKSLFLLILVLYILPKAQVFDSNSEESQFSRFDSLYENVFISTSLEGKELSHQIKIDAINNNDTLNLVKSLIYIVISEIQKKGSDSLEQILEMSLINSQKINDVSLEVQTLNALGYFYFKLNNYEKSLKYLNSAEELLPPIENRKIKLQTYYLLANSYSKTIDRNISLEYAGKVIEYSKGKSSYLARIFLLIAIMYRDAIDNERAIEFLKKSIEISEAKDDWKLSAYNYVILARYIKDYSSPEDSEQYYEKAIQISKEHNYSHGLGYGYMNYAGIYFKRRDFKEALDLNRKALFNFKKTNNNHYLAYTNNNIAEIFFNSGIIDSAEIYVKYSLSYANLSNNKIALANAYHLLGKIAENKSLYEDAIKYYKASAKGDFVGTIIENYSKISEIYSFISLPDSALKYLKLRNALKDSIFSAKTQRLVIDTQIKYDVQQKVRELELSQIENENLENELNQVKNTSVIFIILGFVVIIIVLFYYRNKTLEFVKKIFPNAEGGFTDRRKYKKVIQAIENSLTSTEKEKWNEDEISKEIVNNLKRLMTEEKIFINPKISQKEIAERLKTNTTYLSRTINLKYNLNFSNFVNRYRIEEAKKIILNDKNKTYSFEGIANTVGFSSKSAFYNAFKKFTGKTPSEFSDFIQKQ